MKKTLSTTIVLMMVTGALCSAQEKTHGYPYNPVPFTDVKVETNSFWGQRIQASRDVTIPLAFDQCEKNGRFKNFEYAANPSGDYNVSKLEPYSFDDTDVYKTIEGASYLLQTFPNEKLEIYIDSILDIVAKAQEPDGYLYCARTMNPEHPHHWAGDRRWVKEEDLSHELYNLGHMVEGAIAHYQATGSRKFLDIAIKYADCVVKEVGPNPGQACVVPGHQIPEMALAKLYVLTGEKKYLDEAKFFLDYKGKTESRTEYNQSHKPVLEQDEAVGHAVRAGYMYAGMADVAALTGDEGYIKAIDNIWNNIVGKKYYITGGVGATSSGEAFGANYELPNMSAYCETCAAIAQVYLNYRLFLLHGESRYYDALERTLYNGVLSGVSIDGGNFFYPNPLESMGQHQRQPWFGCACCPSNICRFIPSVPGYAYQTKDNSLYINLFLANKANIEVNGKTVEIEQQTNYPWDGHVDININKTKNSPFTIKVRIPGWVRNQAVPSDLYFYADNKLPNYTVKVNGKAVEAELQDGYFCINRKWKAGDKVSLDFDMIIRTVKANGKVSADRGRVAIERGPLVYCAEWSDNNFNIRDLLLNQKPEYQLIENDPALDNTLLKGINTITTQAQILSFNDKGQLTTTSVCLKLIPYYAWNHRKPGNMNVWIPIDLNATSPSKPATLASKSKVTASQEVPSINAVNDRLVPRDGNDRSVPYTHWWPKNGSTEWLQYDLPQKTQVQCSSVYWFDDQPWGGCKVPDSWRILYKDDSGSWQPVANPDAYNTAKGVGNTVHFTPVTTDALRLEIKFPEDKSCGVFEWEIE